MTVVNRRRPQPDPQPVKRGRRRAPLKQRFPRGQRVQVYEDMEDSRYAEKIGTVVSTVEEGDDIYPHGRVEVRLVYDELMTLRYFSRTRAPKTVWFKPNYLERLDA